ncbi:putative bifunctional diguanylate cyclase/phosphodiesterase [Stackebrandtia soli]|uniref:putative bifunctional diguanylate cyclase/phosphodiesterase n=1 Tax=Stackebrandtia soli TaxID=1892856 RepID=UPI0039ED271D
MAAVVAAAVVAVALTLALSPPMWIPTMAAVPVAVWLMAVLAVLVEVRPVLPPGSRYSQAAMISLSFVIALLLLWGFLPALIVQTVVAVLIFTGLHATAWRMAFNAAQWALALTAAHLVLIALDAPTTISGRDDAASAVGALLLAGLAWFVVSHILVTTTWALRIHVSWWRLCVRSLRYEMVVHGALLAFAPLLAMAASLSPVLVLLSAGPIYAVYRMARLSTERERVAMTDMLTGLPNRKGFQQVVNENIDRCADAGTKLAVLVLDLNRFATVNSALGHDVGDRLLQELGRRFERACDGSSRVAARIGGDEFAFLLAEITGEEDAKRQAVRVQAALADAVWLDEVSVDASGAIGVACYPEHGRDFDSLFKHADVAMSEAKSRDSGLAVYAPEFDHHSVERLGLLGDLRRALELPDPPGVELYYQPQIELSTGEVVGVEALLRYHHPTQGRIDPGELIAIAEHSAVMRILTYRVLDEAVGQLSRWRASGLRLRAAVNVSVRDLHAADFCEYLTDRLEHHGVPPEALQLEIIESALMADPRRVVATLTKLEALGVGLSLDDFGTGFSSMQHLRRLQVSEVKIDKSFVLAMNGDPDSVAIVRSIIDLGRALGLRVVAEGVEDERTWRHLLSLGCDLAQGWFHAKPMPAAELAAWLARYRPPAVMRAVRAVPEPAETR